MMKEQKSIRHGREEDVLKFFEIIVFRAKIDVLALLYLCAEKRLQVEKKNL